MKEARKPRAVRQPRRKPERKPVAPKPEPVKPAPAPATKFEPLRVFRPEEAGEQPKPAKPKRSDTGEASRQLKALTKEVRKALKKLEQGNAVAAYQILQKADLQT
jgi:hypothetical protein